MHVHVRRQDAESRKYRALRAAGAGLMQGCCWYAYNERLWLRLWRGPGSGPTILGARARAKRPRMPRYLDKRIKSRGESPLHACFKPSPRPPPFFTSFFATRISRKSSAATCFRKCRAAFNATRLIYFSSHVPEMFRFLPGLFFCLFLFR